MTHATTVSFHFSQSETVSIRAYGAQEAFIDVSLKHINHYTRTARTFHNLSRWIAVRMDVLGTVFITILATYMVYFQKQGSSSIGFSLNMACAHFFWFRSIDLSPYLSSWIRDDYPLWR
jgi:hypothetical protein